jgi:hypothetical protein
MSHSEPTPLLEELAILLGAADFWANAEPDEDHPDPQAIVRESVREANEIVQRLAYNADGTLIKLPKEQA